MTVRQSGQWDCVTVWQYDCVTVWQCDCVIVWQWLCDSVTVWLCGCVWIVWQCDSDCVTVWQYGQWDSVTVWQWDNLDSETVWQCDCVTVCDSVTTLYTFIELYQQTVQGEAASWRCECPWWFCWHPWYPKSFQMKGTFTKLSNVSPDCLMIRRDVRLQTILTHWNLSTLMTNNQKSCWESVSNSRYFFLNRLEAERKLSLLSLPHWQSLMSFSNFVAKFWFTAEIHLNGGSRFLETWGQHISWESFPPHSLQLENTWKL